MPGFLTPYLNAIIVVVTAIITLAATALYDRVVDDPAVRRQALSGYVRQAELDAANAKLAETQRQRDVAAQALEEHRKRIAALQAAQAAADARREQERADHEKALVAAGRHDGLTDADIKWLRRP